MTNYVKRLVSKKVDSHTNETSDLSKVKGYRRRIHRLVPPTEEPPHSTSSHVATTAVNNHTSPRRIRRYMRTALGTTGSDEKKTENKKTTSNACPVESTNNGIKADPTEKPSDVPSQEPKQSIPWDEEGSKTDLSKSQRLEHENLQRELLEVKMDRDILKQQLIEAKNELETAKVSLRSHIEDLEGQLSKIRQSERLEDERQENSLLEEDLERLAELAREQASHASNEPPPFNKADTKLLYKEKIQQLEDALEQRTNREHVLEQEVAQLKEIARVEAEKTKEIKRKIYYFEQQERLWEASMHEKSEQEGKPTTAMVTNEMDANEKDDGGSDVAGRDTQQASQSSDPSLTLLRQQRLELEERVQELLDETGTLRMEQEVFKNEKERHGCLVTELQNKLKRQEEQHRLETILLDRQLNEWRNRSEAFETKLDEERTLVDQRGVRNLLERHEWSQRVEELEIANSDLKASLQKNRVSFDHEKGYLKRMIQSLEQKINEPSVVEESEVNPPALINEDNDSEMQSSPAKSEEEDVLRARIYALEAETKVLGESERTLSEKLKIATNESKEARKQAEMAEERAKVLQTYLDASMSASPKRAKQIEEEYFSLQRNQEEDESDPSIPSSKERLVANEKQQVVHPKATPKRVTSETNDTNKNFLSVYENEIALNASDTSFEVNIERPKDLKEGKEKHHSKPSNDVVQNLHLQLDEEIEKLKKRKERRRERAVSKASPPSVRQYRSLLSPTMTPKVLSMEEKETSITDFGFPPVDKLLKPQLSHTTVTADLSSSSLTLNTDHIEVENTLDSKNRPGIMEGEPQPQPGWRTAKPVSRNNMGPSKRLDSSSDSKEAMPGSTLFDSSSVSPQQRNVALEAKLHSEIHELKQQKDIVESTLNTKIAEESKRRRNLEAEHLNLMKALEIANQNSSELEKRLFTVTQDNESSHDQIKKLSADLLEQRSSLSQQQKEKEALMHQIESLRNELAVLEKSNANDPFAESGDQSTFKPLGFRDEDTLVPSLDDKILRLEQKIVALEAESKSNIESISSERDIALQEKSVLEKRLLDATQQLHESIENEASLKKIIEETSSKMASLQVEYHDFSKMREEETDKLNAKLKEKDQYIADLKQEAFIKERRLEQASAQLSEMENELLDRDEEIEKLDEKRRHIENSASKQLVELEKMLEKDGEEIGHLEDEKANLQALIKEYEDQIEKQSMRLAEGSAQLAEMESELFSKDDDILEIELKLNAMQALEAQRIESSSNDWELEKHDLEKRLQQANERIQDLTLQIEKLKIDYEAEKNEARRLQMEQARKEKELSSSKTQLSRQLQNVSKLTEQNDTWQAQLERSVDEKEELLKKVDGCTTQISLLHEQIEEANETIKNLEAVNVGLKDDLECANEEDTKNRRRIAQMEEQREALSEELESAMDNLSALEKQYESSTAVNMS